MPEPPCWVPRGGCLSAADHRQFAQVRWVTVASDEDWSRRDRHRAAADADATSHAQELDCREKSGEHGQAQGRQSRALISARLVTGAIGRLQIRGGGVGLGDPGASHAMVGCGCPGGDHDVRARGWHRHGVGAGVGAPAVHRQQPEQSKGNGRDREARFWCPGRCSRIPHALDLRQRWVGGQAPGWRVAVPGPARPASGVTRRWCVCGAEVAVRTWTPGDTT